MCGGRCCIGMVIGFILALAVLVAAGLGVYYYFNPEERNRQVRQVEENVWQPVKDAGDKVLDRAYTKDTKKPALPSLVPEPKVQVNVSVK